jgi:magnesium transporter
MISAYDVTDGLLRKLDCSNDGTDLVEATWVDLLNPTAEREAAVEAALSVAISTREAVREIDASSQIYRENGSLVMTARVVGRNEARGLRLVPATCILKSGTLSGEAVMAGLPAGPSAGALRARLCSAGARRPPNPAMT